MSTTDILSVADFDGLGSPSYGKIGDFAGDGTRHANACIEKPGMLLLRFFKTDTTARPWFARP